MIFRLTGTTITGTPTAESISQAAEMSDYQQTSISLLRAQLKVLKDNNYGRLFFI